MLNKLFNIDIAHYKGQHMNMHWLVRFITL